MSEEGEEEEEEARVPSMQIILTATTNKSRIFTINNTIV